MLLLRLTKKPVHVGVILLEQSEGVNKKLWSYSIVSASKYLQAKTEALLHTASRVAGLNFLRLRQ